MAETEQTPVNERKRGSGVKMVYDILRDEILDLVLPPGSAVDEVQLAERFGMSRTPIREALVRLSGEGLIDTLPNRSTMVSNIDFLNMHTYFDALTLMYRVTTQLAAQHHRAGQHLLEIGLGAAVAAQRQAHQLARGQRGLDQAEESLARGRLRCGLRRGAGNQVGEHGADCRA